MRFIAFSCLAAILVGGGGAAAALSGQGTGPATGAGTVRTVDIVGTDDMKYSITKIDARSGEQLRIRLTRAGGFLIHHLAARNQGITQKTEIGEPRRDDTSEPQGRRATLRLA